VLVKRSLSRMTKPLPWGSHEMMSLNASDDMICMRVSGKFNVLMIGSIWYGSGSLERETIDEREAAVLSW